MAMNKVILVPAPREYTGKSGEFRVVPKVTYRKVDWLDFDIVEECMTETLPEWTHDSSLPTEGYKLSVSNDGINISAADEAGAFYARATLRQLAVVDDERTSVTFPCCEIRDWPSYRWRGVLIDEARHFLGKEVVMRTLDNMAYHKLNVLHWHLTDDQGWRIDIPGHPELVKYGSVRPESVKYGTFTSWKPPEHKLGYSLNGQKYGPYFYSREDIGEILAYAKSRHVTVVPEIELPGHARALLAARPELSCRGDLPQIPRVYWSIEDDVICVGNDKVLELYYEIFDSVCEMFPDTPFIHIGGDECPRKRWHECPKCQARMKAEDLADETGLQSWITSKIVRYLEKKGRRAIGWDEMLVGDVPVSSVGMSWRNVASDESGVTYVSPAEAVKRGHDMIMTPVDTCYLCRHQGIRHDPYPYYSPWAKALTLETAYSFDPCQGIPEDGRKHILGGQASVWGEFVWSVFDLEWKTWPRACATAEVLWLGADKPGYEDFYRRMKEHRISLLDAHVNCAPVDVDGLM